MKKGADVVLVLLYVMLVVPMLLLSVEALKVSYTGWGAGGPEVALYLLCCILAIYLPLAPFLFRGMSRPIRIATGLLSLFAIIAIWVPAFYAYPPVSDGAYYQVRYGDAHSNMVHPDAPGFIVIAFWGLWLANALLDDKKQRFSWFFNSLAFLGSTVLLADIVKAYPAYRTPPDWVWAYPVLGVVFLGLFWRFRISVFRLLGMSALFSSAFIIGLRAMYALT